jgi:hypothetical protein
VTLPLGAKTVESQDTEPGCRGALSLLELHLQVRRKQLSGVFSFFSVRAEEAEHHELAKLSNLAPDRGHSCDTPGNSSNDAARKYSRGEPAGDSSALELRGVATNTEPSNCSQPQLGEAGPCADGSGGPLRNISVWGKEIQDDRGSRATVSVRVDSDAETGPYHGP